MSTPIKDAVDKGARILVTPAEFAALHRILHETWNSTDELDELKRRAADVLGEGRMSVVRENEAIGLVTVVVVEEWTL